MEISDQEKVKLFDEIYSMNYSMHWELNAYKRKRKDRKSLLEKRKASPQTKTMKKKLGLTPKPKFDRSNIPEDTKLEFLNGND